MEGGKVAFAPGEGFLRTASQWCLKEVSLASAAVWVKAWPIVWYYWELNKAGIDSKWCVALEMFFFRSPPFQ